MRVYQQKLFVTICSCTHRCSAADRSESDPKEDAIVLNSTCFSDIGSFEFSGECNR